MRHPADWVAVSDQLQAEVDGLSRRHDLMMTAVICLAAITLATALIVSKRLRWVPTA